MKLNKNVGSSTAVLAKLDRNNPNILKTTNLGDSGYMLFRVRKDESENKYVLDKLHRSKE